MSDSADENMDIIKSSFEGDPRKEQRNIHKHGVSFEEAKHIFLDPKRIIIEDTKHSSVEARYFCFGKVQERILTVRFVIRGEKTRIYGAGFWREGRETYEKKNQIH
jgi:uncharacterized DUF497 family protein